MSTEAERQQFIDGNRPPDHLTPVHVERPAQEPSVGRIVHYVLHTGPHAGEHRPALIVRVWNDDLVNLQVFTDDNPIGTGNDKIVCPHWATSAKRDASGEALNSWHWPERVP